jgi:hypothetical protein
VMREWSVILYAEAFVINMRACMMQWKSVL